MFYLCGYYASFPRTPLTFDVKFFRITTDDSKASQSF